MDAVGDGGNDEARALLGGSIRKKLGLETIDLLPGLDLAKNHLKRGATGEAMRLYAALVLCEPSNVEFQVGLANCALAMDEHHLALQAASVVIALSPKDPRGYFLSGRACLGLGHNAEALEDLREAIRWGTQGGEAAIVDDAQRLLDKATRLQS